MGDRTQQQGQNYRQQQLLRLLVEGYLDGDQVHGPPTAQDLGVLGRFFGGRYANTYIAGVVALFACLLLGGLVVLNAVVGPLEHGREFVTGSFSLLGLALGYLFGSSRR